MPSDKKKSQQSSQRKTSGKGLRVKFATENNKIRTAKRQESKQRRKINHFLRRLESGKPVPHSTLGNIARNQFILGS